MLKLYFSTKIDALPYNQQVLNEFLRLKNYKVFKALINKWPCDIYDLKCITNAVLDAQRCDSSHVLLEAIAVLYEYQHLYEKAFVIYINLCDQTVFDFLLKHELYECAFDNMIALITLNRKVIHMQTLVYRLFGNMASCFYC